MRAPRVRPRRGGLAPSLPSVSAFASAESDAASDRGAASSSRSSPPSSPTTRSSGGSVLVLAMDMICPGFQCASVLSRNELDVGHLGRVAHLLDADSHPPCTRLL